MSKYTTEVRYICEQYAGLEESKGFDSVDEILNLAIPKVFNFKFPIFDENYRTVLEKKILKHYYTREIGAETVGLWKLWLDTRLNEIMPYYNKLYESELIEFNPMYNADYTRTYQKGNEGENHGIKERGGVTTDRMTGTVTDDGQDVLRQTGTISSDSEYDEKYTGDVKNTGTVTNVKDRDVVTGIDEEKLETGTDAIAKTGTETHAKTGTDTRTDNLHEARTSHDKTDRWDYYNDTPQGGINGVEDLEYLTNVRHITDDGTGSGGTTDNTGTQATQYNNTLTDTFNSTQTETKNLTTATDTDKTEAEDITDTRTDNLKEEYNTDKAGTNEKVDTFNKTDTNDKDNVRTYNTTNTINKEDNETNDVTISSMEDYTEHVIGKMPYISFSRMLEEFRDTFLNIDLMIIDELSDLFMLIY